MASDTEPTSYGVFKPTGHVVVILPTAGDCVAAASDLVAAGFAAADIRRYTPEQMMAQVASDLANASPLSGIGQESNLVKAHGELARQGAYFLVVKASGDEAIEQVTEIALRHHAIRAQRYGMLVIEELIPVGDFDHQVAESTSRGLDAQTPTGDEDAQATASTTQRG